MGTEARCRWVEKGTFSGGGSWFISLYAKMYVVSANVEALIFIGWRAYMDHVLISRKICHYEPLIHAIYYA
jgi:hypothetical protein